MFFTILAACFKSKSSVFVVQSFTLRGEVNKTGRPVLTGFYYLLIITATAIIKANVIIVSVISDTNSIKTIPAIIDNIVFSSFCLPQYDA